MICIARQTFYLITYRDLMLSESICLEDAPYVPGKVIDAQKKGWVSRINIPPGVGRLAP